MNSNKVPATAATASAGLLAVLASKTAAATPDTPCEARLSVELTLNVPNAGDEGFLSSLLNNHPDYHLNLPELDSPSLIEIELEGPGPEYRCQNVIDTIRKDARVLAVRVESVEPPPPRRSNLSLGTLAVTWPERSLSPGTRVPSSAKRPRCARSMLAQDLSTPGDVVAHHQPPETAQPVSYSHAARGSAAPAM